MSEQAPPPEQTDPLVHDVPTGTEGTDAIGPKEYTAPGPETDPTPVDEEGNLTELGVRQAQAGLPGWVGPSGVDEEGNAVEGAQPFDPENAQPDDEGDD